MIDFIKRLLRRRFNEPSGFTVQAASFDWSVFVKQCLNSPRPINDAVTPYKVTVTRVPPAAGQVLRCIGVHHLTGAENGGKQHLYVDVLDQRGRRIYGAQIIGLNADGRIKLATVDKPANEPGTNMPLWAKDRVNLKADFGALPSDTVHNLATGPEKEGEVWPDEPGNSLFHNSFGILFQVQDVIELGDPPPPPDDLPSDWPGLLERLDRQERRIEALEEWQRRVKQA